MRAWVRNHVPEVRSPLCDDDVDGDAVPPEDIDQRLAVEARNAIVKQIGGTLPRGATGEGNLEISELIALRHVEEEAHQLTADAHVVAIRPTPSGVPRSVECWWHRRNCTAAPQSRVIEMVTQIGEKSRRTDQGRR